LLRSFPRTAQAPVTRAPASLEDLRIYAPSIVAYPHTEQAIVVSNFSFDMLRLGVPKGILQNLAGNSVDFRPRQRRQASLLALNGYPEAR
jgi:hypothetical protein